jgi:lipid A 3-O-deacylase
MPAPVGNQYITYIKEKMMRKFGYFLFMLIFLLIGSSIYTYGYQESENRDLVAYKPEFEWEYLVPTSVSRRDIDTISLNILEESRSTAHVAIYKGITFTRAWGNMTRFGVTSDCGAFGIGPTYLMRIRVKKWDTATFFWDMSGALIFYNKDFPNNGDFYNFMWRIGPILRCQIGEHTLLNIGYKLMHVSNGQLYWPELTGTPHNPAYNAKGLSLAIVHCF